MTKRKLISLTLTLAVFLSASAYGPCNKQNSLEAAAEAAKDIGGGTRDVIRAVGEAYDKKLISLEQKDRLADILIAISKGGQKGVDAIELLHQQGVEDPTPDQSRLLMKIFDDDVVAPFLTLLTELGKLSDTQSAAIRAALISVRAAIVLLSSKVGRADMIKRIEAREVLSA